MPHVSLRSRGQSLPTTTTSATKTTRNYDDGSSSKQPVRFGILQNKKGYLFVASLVLNLFFSTRMLNAPKIEVRSLKVEANNPQEGKPAQDETVLPPEVVVGEQGGAWTAQTHLSIYGFNVDWGLMEVLEDASRQIENTHNEPNSQWHQYDNPDPHHVLNKWWVAPKVVDAKVMEVGCGVGVYVDALKKEQNKKRRKVYGVEPNPMGGTFLRKNGPVQLAVNILEQEDTHEFAKSIRQKELHGDYFDLIYSIEVFEHMPLDRHEDAARFLAGLAKPGTKLIFGASSPGQSGTGHIGNRSKEEWEKILKKVGFHKDAEATSKAQQQIQEYSHKKNMQVYWFRGGEQGSIVSAA